MKYFRENADLWAEGKELSGPDYTNRFEDPDCWIWKYVDISQEPWVEWPSEDNFHRYDKAIIYVNLPEYIVQSSERRP